MALFLDEGSEFYNPNENYTNLSDDDVERLETVFLDMSFYNCLKVLNKFPALELAHKTGDTRCVVKDTIINRFVSLFKQEDVFMPAIKRLQSRKWGVLELEYKDKTKGSVSSYPADMFYDGYHEDIKELLREIRSSKMSGVELLNSQRFRDLGLIFYFGLYCVMLETIALSETPLHKIYTSSVDQKEYVRLNINNLKCDLSVKGNDITFINISAPEANPCTVPYHKSDFVTYLNFQEPTFQILCDYPNACLFVDLPAEYTNMDTPFAFTSPFEIDIRGYSISNSRGNFYFTTELRDDGKEYKCLTFHSNANSVGHFPPMVFDFKHKFMITSVPIFKNGMLDSVSQNFQGVQIGDAKCDTKVSVTFRYKDDQHGTSRPYISGIKIEFELPEIKLLRHFEWGIKPKYTHFTKFMDKWYSVYRLEDLENGWLYEFIHSNADSYIQVKLPNGMDAFIPESKTIRVPLITRESIFCEHRFASDVWKEYVKAKSVDLICPRCRLK